LNGETAVVVVAAATETGLAADQRWGTPI